MTDQKKLKKVIRGLKCLAGMNEMKSNPCMDCGYQECQTYAICIEKIARDAFSLLKAQQPKQVFPIGYIGTSDSQYATCPWCFSRIHSNESQHYCGHCGREVKWE